MKKLYALIPFLILHWCGISVQRSMFKALGAYLEIFKDKSISAVTIISETTLSDNLLEELICFLTELNFPISIIHLEDTSNQDIREAISIQGTFIIVVNDDNNTIDFIRKLSNEVLITNPFIVVPHPENLLHNSTSSNFKEIFEPMMNLSFDALLYYLEIDWKGNGRILEVYQIQQGCEFTIFPLYQIRSFILLDEDLKYIWFRRRNLQGMHFRIGYIKDGPYFTFDEKSGPGGIFYEVYKILRQNLNITETFIESVDGLYGTNNESGIVGMLYRRELDFSILDFSITKNRDLFVDFTRGITVQDMLLYSLKRGNVQSWGTFVGVFSQKFWLAVIVCIICSMFITWLVFKIVENERTIGLLDSIATPLRTMGALSIPETPTRAPCRILIVTICFVGAMIYWVYNAGLTSLLTVDESTMVIQSLQDFITKPEYQILIAKGTSLERSFIDAEKNRDTEMAEIYRKKIEPNPEALYSTLDEAKYKIFNNPKYILFMPKTTFDTKFINESCLFQKSTNKYFQTNLAWVTKKGFRYLQLFDFQLYQIMEAGFMKKLTMTFSGGKNHDCEQEDFTPIKISNIISAYAILGIGILCSMGILFIEKSFHSINKELKDKKRVKRARIQLHREVQIM